MKEGRSKTTERRSLRLLEARAGRSAPLEVVERRKAMLGAVDGGVWRTERAPIVETLGGVRVLRFQPPAARRGVVLHLHGGGFRLGCPEMIGPFSAALAERCGVEVVLPAYRLAPEHPFPAGLVDARAVLAALRREGAGPIVISGDSAGGGLAAGLTALSLDEGHGPSGLVLLSPWLDLTCESACYQANADTDPLFSLGAAQLAAELYLQGLSPRDPLVSPRFADVAGFPPTFVSVGSGEVLADDGRGFHQALRAAGVEASLLAVDGMDHVAVTRGLTLPGSAETFEALAGFIDRFTR
ncbi:alpha/beta hydrolase [Phenylobacterium sp. LjRoot225]|uniref:alpha/beta hydrolase n=1 Tax=Phenylobacterium sp. LjRoot225 TaxID=3342285 RepID=UPI003ECFE811